MRLKAVGAAEITPNLFSSKTNSTPKTMTGAPRSDLLPDYISSEDIRGLQQRAQLDANHRRWMLWLYVLAAIVVIIGAPRAFA